MFQFANIARPVMLHQGLNRFVRQLVAAAIFIQEVRDQAGMSSRRSRSGVRRIRMTFNR